MTDHPKKFTPDQVLAVFADRGAQGAPMRTTQIAELVRAAYGVPTWRGDVKGNTDVAGALKSLQAAGDLVSSMGKHNYGRSPKNWLVPREQGDAEHFHLVPPDATGERYYATPAQSANWKRLRERIAERVETAETLAGALDAEIARFSSTEPIRTRVSAKYGKEPIIGMSLTIEQAEHLIGLLTGEI